MVPAMQEAMARKGLSFRDVGFLTDLDPGYLCRVANGKRRLSRPAALRVAKVLGVSPRRLLPALYGATGSLAILAFLALGLMQVSDSPPLLVGVREAGHALGLGRDTVYRLIREGRLRSVTVSGRRVLVPTSELSAFIAREIGEGGGETNGAKDNTPDG